MKLIVFSAILVAACGGVESATDAGGDGDGDAGAAIDAAESIDGPTAPAVGALSFDGTDRFARVASGPALDSSVFTVEFWVFPTSNAIGSVASRWGDSQLWNIGLQSGEIQFTVQTIIGELFLVKRQIGAGAWHHVTARVSDTFIQVTVDGLPVTLNISDAPSQDADTPLILGGSSPLVGGSLLGMLDEVRFWNRLVPLDELEQNRGVEIAPSAPGLVGYWRFNEQPGDQTIVDLSAAGLDGTLGANDDVGADDPDRAISTAPIATAD